ncbi:MAG: TrkH family potassium uptake protein [Acidimicrobiia bacterium]|nr:TrkH family potassium uptake protein [Acidimicrobiia bacterium]
MMNTARRPSLIAQIIGLTLAFSGAGLVLSALVEIAYGDTGDWRVLGLLGLVTLLIGYVLRAFTSIPDRILRLDVFASVTASWLSMALVGMLPFLATGAISDLDMALFESVSGFTTTGATVLQAGSDPTVFDASVGLLFWRSVTQWLGGMGVIVLVVAVLPSVGSWGMGLLEAEAPGPTGERLTPRVTHTAQHLWAFYVGFTLLTIIGYLAAGMNLYDAASHSFTTVSTGGFSRYTLSIAHFESAAVEWVAIAAMLVAGSSFTLLYRLVRGKPGPLVRSVEFRLYVVLVILATFLTWYSSGEPTTMTGLRNSLFTVTAVVTTTGYGTADFGGAWKPPAQAVLLILMPIGAMAGSTAGGVKLVRVLAVASLAHRETLAQLHQKLIRPVRVGRSLIDERVVDRVVGFLVLVLAAFGGSGLLIALTGEDVVTAFSASATTFGNVGPGLGDVGPRSDFAGLTWFARLVCIANMLLGRLEIYPILLALVKLPIPRARPLLARTFRRRESVYVDA